MLRITIVAIVLATLVATWFTRSFIAPGIGAALLFAVILFGWWFNRHARRGSFREAEEAIHRQREERAHDRTGRPH